MEPVAILLTIAAIILSLVFWRRKERGRRDSKFPPGSMGWPLIGETLSFLKHRPVKSLGPFMEQHISRYGKIFSSNLLGKQVVITADPELNRFILKNDMRLFENSWPRSFNRLMGDNSISLLVGDAHKHMRSIVHGFLSNERLRSLFLRDAGQMASLLLSSWKGSLISVTEEANKFSFYIMAKEILSLSPGNPETENLRKEYEKFVVGLISFPLYLPGTAYWKALQSREYILNFVERERKERMTESSKKDDYLSWIMKNTNYSRQKIGDLLLHTLFSGHDTTSRAIAVMMYFLESCPKAIDELKIEHLQLVRKKKEGNGNLTWDDYKNMKFTQCVIQETLRLGNVIGQALKKASEDIHYKDYVIPRGCIVIPHFRAVHMDPFLFEDPQHFNPWRWMCSSGIKKSDNFTPFSGGARICPGSELAKLEMTVFLHHLILNYEWESVEPDHPVSIPVIEFPKGLQIRVRALPNEMEMM